MKKIFINLAVLIQLLISCDPADDRLTIINKTNHDIIISNYLWISDTNLPFLNDKEYTDLNFMVNQIKSKSSFKMIKKGSWNDSFVENDTIIILVYNKDAIIEKKQKKPSENYDIEQTIYVSKSYLEKNEWKINITPENRLKIVKL